MHGKFEKLFAQTTFGLYELREWRSNKYQHQRAPGGDCQYDPPANMPRRVIGLEKLLSVTSKPLVSNLVPGPTDLVCILVISSQIAEDQRQTFQVEPSGLTEPCKLSSPSYFGMGGSRKSFLLNEAARFGAGGTPSALCPLPL